MFRRGLYSAGFILALLGFPYQLIANSEAILAHLSSPQGKQEIAVKVDEKGEITLMGKGLQGVTLEQSGKIIQGNGSGEIHTTGDLLVSGTGKLTLTGTRGISNRIVNLIPSAPHVLPPGVQIHGSGATITVTLRTPQIETLAGKCFITFPGGKVLLRDIPKEFVENDGMIKRGATVTFSFLGDETGMYRIEIPDQRGKAWLNAVFIQGENIFPILPADSHSASQKIEADASIVSAHQREHINTLRLEQGLNAVTQDPTLEKLAQAKIDDMVDRGYFAHIDPDGNHIGLFALKQRIFLPKMLLGENLARGYESDSLLFEGFLLSGSHRYNILLPEWKKIGIGYRVKNGEVFVAQVFGS